MGPAAVELSWCRKKVLKFQAKGGHEAAKLYHLPVPFYSLLKACSGVLLYFCDIGAKPIFSHSFDWLLVTSEIHPQAVLAL